MFLKFMDLSNNRGQISQRFKDSTVQFLCQLLATNFKQVSIWVKEIRLRNAIRSTFGASGNLYVKFLQVIDRGRKVFNPKCKMLAARNNTCVPVSRSSKPRLIVGQGGMNLERIVCKPGAGEIKSWPGNFAHTQHIDVKPSSNLKVGNNNRNVVNAGIHHAR